MSEVIVLFVHFAHFGRTLHDCHWVSFAGLSQLIPTRQWQCQTRSQLNDSRASYLTHSRSVTAYTALLLRQLYILHLLPQVLLRHVLVTKHSLYLQVPQITRQTPQLNPSSASPQNTHHSRTQRKYMSPMPLKLPLRLKYHQT